MHGFFPRTFAWCYHWRHCINGGILLTATDKIHRWNFSDMLETGRRLFIKINKRKHAANHNHEIHFLAREINDWLPKGIQSMINGDYTPQHLKRYYFEDEMVDQLHVSDRIFQHILLKQLKPTFKHVINPNCLHVYGPSGVKLATQRIRQALQEEKPKYIIRADIKSFYKSIPHHKLIQDIKKLYDDSKVQEMLEEVITNPIETPRGYKNPITGIALRGPLSQFFSAIYLKPLDDALSQMDITYIRYQDDIIALCKTKRQLNRCRRKMMEILHERKLKLSRKKSRIGSINKDFHFLGIHYPGTQPQDYTKAPQAVNDRILTISGGEPSNEQIQHVPQCIVPHARTLRKAREQVKVMVATGFSTRRIRSYLKKWAIWWVMTSATWSIEEMLHEYIKSCWDYNLRRFATGISTLPNICAAGDEFAGIVA